MRYILILLLIYIFYRIAKAVVVRRFREMTGADNSQVRGNDSAQKEKRNIEDAKFTEIHEDDDKGKK